MKRPDAGQDRIQLNRVAFYGRTLKEYLKIFDLDLSLIQEQKILDCPAGASSFVAEAHKLGFDAVGCDPLFGSDIRALFERGEQDISHVIERVSSVPHLYKWDFYPSIEVLERYRKEALERFSLDYPSGVLENRYIKGTLPCLPFPDKSFDLVLSGHFLFTYSDQLDISFHMNSILELVRVSSKEVRIYPLQGPDAKPYGPMDTLLSFLEKNKIKADLMPVSFEFQRGSNQILRLSR
jgi:hypothetical protein